MREELVVVRRVVGEFDGGRVLEAVDEHALDLVRRVAVLAGTAHHRHAALGDPAARRVEERVGDQLVVDDFEEAEEPDPRVVELVEAPVDCRRDGSDHLAIAPSEEVGDLGKRVIGVLGGEQPLRAEQLVAEVVGHEWRRPAWVATVEPPREASELVDARVAEAELLDGYGGGHGGFVPER